MPKLAAENGGRGSGGLSRARRQGIGWWSKHGRRRHPLKSGTSVLPTGRDS